MKSKIGKLGYFLIPSSTDESVVDTLQRISEKVDELVEAYNSQDQEEYEKRIRVKVELSGETEHIKAHKEYLATSKQDTPEQKEEGSYVLTYKNLKEIMTLMEEQGTSTVSIEYLMQYCGYPIGMMF